MEPFCEEVQTFIRASEALLSPVTQDTLLNQDERDVIAIYARTVAERFPIKQAG